MSEWLQLGLQDAASPLIEEIVLFHDLAIQLLIFILIGVACRIFDIIINKNSDQTMLEGQIVERVWTVLPALVLVLLGIPSLTLLYIMDESSFNRIRVKSIGHQWYWSYELSDFWGARGALRFDSFITKENSPVRLLDVDSRLVLPVGCQTRVLVTSGDVLHSWAVPRIGVKLDACPGRINQTNLLRHRVGLFFGQCSEICGANHSFMPIVLEVISSKDFKLWVLSQRE